MIKLGITAKENKADTIKETPLNLDKQITMAGVEVIPNNKGVDSRVSEEGTAIKPENEEVILNGDTVDSNIHKNTAPIGGTEQSEEEIANESSISKIIDYFENLKVENATLEAERKKLREKLNKIENERENLRGKLDKIEAKKAKITKTIKEAEALIEEGGDGRDE